MFAWWGYATDDLGNNYDSAGGACGENSDKNKKYTGGVLSFVPLIKEEISFLDVTMIAEKMGKEIKCEFRVVF